ncbi:MAG: SDR family NAD(P)-dependent oxidoreductase [bacterium]
MQPKALLIGNSDGIGLATTRRLLLTGWKIMGVSRSKSPLSNKTYIHRIADVSKCHYSELIKELTHKDPFDLCIYFAGIGKLFDFTNMDHEPKVIEVNLTGMVRTAAAVIPPMVTKGQGHFIGISSVADELLSAQAPSYHASKAGFSHYLESLALALKNTGVQVTNVRFGFVDTKMAKGEVKPFIISIEKAVDHLMKCIKKKPVRYTAPGIIVPLVKFRKVLIKLRGE